MNKTKILLALAMIATATSATAGTKKIGTINGLDVYRIKNLGIFCPSTTTTVLADPKKPGTIEGVVSNAGGTSVLGSVAAPAAHAASAYLHKPDTTNVQQSGGGANATSSQSQSQSNSSSQTQTTTATGGHVPPGHINNPGHNN